MAAVGIATGVARGDITDRSVCVDVKIEVGEMGVAFVDAVELDPVCDIAPVATGLADEDVLVVPDD